jgi:excisionase family DNA binding protein
MSDKRDEELDTVVAGGFGSVDQVAEFLSLSRATIYKMMDARILPSAKLGKSRRLPWAAVKDYAARALHQ